MDEYDESYMAQVEKEVDSIRSAALETARRTDPGIAAVTDPRTLDDYCEKIWDYPGKWYPYFKLPDGFDTKEALILDIAEKTVRYYRENGGQRQDHDKKGGKGTAIVYYSKHHGNTKKLLDAIALADRSVTLIDVTLHPNADISGFDRVGLASGIYFSSFAKQIVAFAEARLPENSDVFYIYTHGAPVGGFLTSVRAVADKKGCREIGRYHCYGFDTFGLFAKIGGISKGHPNEKDIAGAVEFYRSLKTKEL